MVPQVRHDSPAPGGAAYEHDETQLALAIDDDLYAGELARLDTAIATIDTERRNAKKKNIRRAQLSYPWPLFIRKMCLLTSQSWGTRIQNYLVKFYGWTPVAASEDRGDALDGKEHVEIKVTLITNGSNVDANFVQLRPYQDIAGYRLFVVDADFKVWRFDLNKTEMLSEIAQVGGNAHGTETSAGANINREYAVRFRWTDNATRKRWLADYHVPGTVVVTPAMMRSRTYETAATIATRLGTNKESSTS